MSRQVVARASEVVPGTSKIVTVKGRVDAREDTPKFMATDITVVEGLDENAQPLRLKLSPNASLPSHQTSDAHSATSSHARATRAGGASGRGRDRASDTVGP